MKILRTASSVIIGLVFIFSGIVKAIDPLGSAYKFHDYFQAFHIGFLSGLSLPLAILLCTAEFISGFSVLTGIRQKTGMWGIFILLAIFTPVTFILALTNPVTDCGCFGDAIHLTNWQTFGKNIVLFAMWIIVYQGRNLRKNIFTQKNEWLVIAGTCVVFVFFCLANLRYLPVIDFLPYKKNIRIADKMVVPEGVATDQYKTTFLYQKDGVTKEFGLDNYPAGDSTWKFIDQKSVLIKKGYEPPIHDFQITSIDGENLTDKILSDKGYSLLMISKKLHEAKRQQLEDGFRLGIFCRSNNISFYVVTSSGTDELKSYANNLTFCTADETTLKTMVRANPGYILLKDGIIIGKWSWANIPHEEWFGRKAQNKP